MAKPKKGDRAPDFSLKDQNENVFKLSEFKSRNVLLSFHPLAWTPVCSAQMKSLERNREEFDSLNTVAVGVSIDTVPSKKAWAKSLGIRHTRLLADFWPHGQVADTYDLFRAKDGVSERANVIIDKNQKVAFIRVYKPSTLPDIREVLEALRKIG